MVHHGIGLKASAPVHVPKVSRFPNYPFFCGFPTQQKSPLGHSTCYSGQSTTEFYNGVHHREGRAINAVRSKGSETLDRDKQCKMLT
jgi:hypothetical protein